MLGKGSKVMQCNSLVKVAYKLTLSEKRLLLCAISELQQKKFKDLRVTIKATDYLNIYNLSESSSYVYRALKNGLFKLATLEPIHELTKTGGEVTTWITGGCYNEGDGSITINFTPEIAPYLLELSGYVSYKLEEIEYFTSLASIRLYELVLQHEKLGGFKFKLEKFKGLMGVEGLYPEFGDFKRRVIEPALTQIQEFTPYKLDFEAIKKGRKISDMQFTIKNIGGGKGVTKESPPLSLPPQIKGLRKPESFVQSEETYKSPKPIPFEVHQEMIRLKTNDYTTAEKSLVAQRQAKAIA